MKTLLRNLVMYSTVLYLLPRMLPGVTVSGGLATVLIGGIILALMMFTIKPVLSLISFPLNAFTLGLSSVFINAFVLYLFTIFYPSIAIQPFTVPARTILGFGIPSMHFNMFFAFLVTALALSAIISFIQWLID